MFSFIDKYYEGYSVVLNDVAIWSSLPLPLLPRIATATTTAATKLRTRKISSINRVTLRFCKRYCFTCSLDCYYMRPTSTTSLHCKWYGYNAHKNPNTHNLLISYKYTQCTHTYWSASSNIQPVCATTNSNSTTTTISTQSSTQFPNSLPSLEQNQLNKTFSNDSPNKLRLYAYTIYGRGT